MTRHARGRVREFVGSWPLALRLARRTARRNVGRSVLVAALLAVPVWAATTLVRRLT